MSDCRKIQSLIQLFCHLLGDEHPKGQDVCVGGDEPERRKL